MEEVMLTGAVKPCALKAVHSREKKKRRRWRFIVV
jgi:hypothetical protein